MRQHNIAIERRHTIRNSLVSLKLIISTIGNLGFNVNELTLFYSFYDYNHEAKDEEFKLTIMLHRHLNVRNKLEMVIVLTDDFSNKLDNKLNNKLG
ncbi:hypothetical protein TUM4641_27200 [Shewanella morhuae]|nr:hypothetical protein TUM4641_27200 [Shewanella morhuae]